MDATNSKKLTVGQKVTDGDARDPINGEVVRIKGRQVQVRHWGRGAAAVAASGLPERFGKPRKVAITYSSPLDLVRQVLGEGGAEYAR